MLHGIDLTVRGRDDHRHARASGCGKTTLLRVVAGFHTPDTGEVRIGDELVAGPGTSVPPEQRGLRLRRAGGQPLPAPDGGGNIAFGLPRARAATARRVG